MAGIGEVIHGGPVTREDFARIRETLLFEEPGRSRKLVRFACLIVLAAAIATFGLLADSEATVIGAMIVAPLMLPIMGLAFGTSIADRRAMASSITVSLGGIAAAIAVGLVLSLPIRSLLHVEASTQIMARTSPRLIDLLAALATGLAGGFATSRKDVSDTLPGVAIAISLVPPLTNAGILLAAGRVELALGSLLLFVTNFLAIVLTGTLLFAVMGFPRAALSEASPKARRNALALVLTLVLVIAVPLGSSSYRAVTDSLAEQRAAKAARAWIRGSDYRLVSARGERTFVRVTVAGQGDLPPLDDLQAALRGRLCGKSLAVDAVTEFRRTVPIE